MPYPRHVMQSVEIQAVTNFRASGDYSQGRSDQWKIGQSSIVAHALSLGPSKDNYWSIAAQPDSDWATSTEPRSALQSAVSSYSTGMSRIHCMTARRFSGFSLLSMVRCNFFLLFDVASVGPVAPSDRIKYSNASLINRACTPSGLLLKPSKPATAIDATFPFRAGISSHGPDGEVWSTFTEFRGSG